MAVLTPKFRVSYPNVFKPKTNQLSGKEEYSVMALFPKGADLSKLKAAHDEALVKKFGADKARWPKNLKNPFRDQADLEKDGKQPPGTEPGAIFMNFKSTIRPGLVDQQVQDILVETDFYAGCYARASVSAFAFDVNGSRGVAFGLGNLQKLGEGDPLGGRTKPEHDFEAVVDNSQSATEMFT